MQKQPNQKSVKQKQKSVKSKAKPGAKHRGRNPYPATVIAECRDMFCNREMDGRAISRYFGGEPSAMQISRWARQRWFNGEKHPNSCKCGECFTWYEERRLRAEDLYGKMSPEGLTRLIWDRIGKSVANETEFSKFSDSVVKLVKAIKELKDPSLQIPVMYHMLQDLTLFAIEREKAGNREFITSKRDNGVRQEWKDLVMAFKDHIRARLLG